jgi:hypothetical protein
MLLKKSIMTTSVTGMVNHESIMTSAIKRMNESEMMVKIENQCMHRMMIELK